MRAREDDGATVTLWRPVGQAELDLVAASGWRAWPPRLPEQPTFSPVLDRRLATKTTRTWNVAAGGVGYVTSFDVRREFLDRHAAHQAGGPDALEYRIPAEELPELNAAIVGAIREEADYRGPVAEQEFTDAARALGAPLPAPWRDYLQGRSWLRRGWLPNGEYLWLYTPRETLEQLDAWGESTPLHPGIAIIGGDGAREQLVLDLRRDPSPVLLVPVVSDGWQDAPLQAETVTSFLEQVEAGTFEFTF